MTRRQLDWPGTLVPSLLAALTSWVALWAWAGFVESPSRYLDPALFTLLLIAAGGVLLRSLRVPPLVVLAGQVVMVAVWLTRLWAPDEAALGFIPTRSSMVASGEVLRDAVITAQTYPAPVPDTAPLLFPLLLAAGALVGLLVDFLANGLRRVPVAGLPLLAVYTAPVSILAGGVPWWVFAAGATGFLALLATDEGRRLEHWGRPVSRQGTVVDTAGGIVGSTSLRSSARRIGLTATTLAVVSPVVIPTLSGDFLPGNGPGTGGGGDSVTITNPMVNLRRDLVRGTDVDLLTIRTPNANPSYLRISVLDSFTEAAWSPSDRDIPPEQSADGLLPRPPGLASDVARRQVDYEISIEDAFDSTWLPAPYPVTTIDVPGDWRYDADTLDFVNAVKGEGVAGLDYTLTALETSPSAPDLVDAPAAPDEIFDPYTELPSDLSPMVADLARQVTSQVDSRFEKAVRLQRWFREDGGFEYSLDRDPGTGADDLEAFLSDGPGGRIGYCEQFAASMALMGRTLGIPSRVAVGFLTPDRVDEDVYVYSAYDLHAWPEMYFEGAGWVRFEPTPDDRAGGVPGYTVGNINAPQPADTPSSAAPTTNPRNVQEDRLRGEAAPTSTGDGGGGPGGIGLAVPLVLLLVALLLSPWLARTLVRRRRWVKATTPAAAAEAGWRELRDTALDLRLPWETTRTLRTRAADLATAFGRVAEQREGLPRGGARGARANPEAAAALDRLVRDVERARYSRGAGGHGRAVDAVRSDVATCVEALRAGAVKRRRRAAIWLPASLVRNGVVRAALVDSRIRRPSVTATVVDPAR